MQTVLVIIAVGLAAFYLIRRFVLTMQRKQKSGCEKCAMNPHVEEKE
jgi:hypothetical protein